MSLYSFVGKKLRGNYPKTHNLVSLMMSGHVPDSTCRAFMFVCLFVRQNVLIGLDRVALLQRTQS